MLECVRQVREVCVVGDIWGAACPVAVVVAEEHEAVTRQARDRVRDVIKALRLLPPSEATTTAIEQATIELDEQWIPRLAHIRRQLIVLRENRRQLEEDQNDWLTSVRAQSSAILASGLSIVICIAVFLTVFFGLRFVSGLIVGKRREGQFPRRLLKMLLHVLTLAWTLS